MPAGSPLPRQAIDKRGVVGEGRILGARWSQKANYRGGACLCDWQKLLRSGASLPSYSLREGVAGLGWDILEWNSRLLV